MRVTLFIPSHGDGGVARDFVNLASGLSTLGVAVDYVTATGEGAYLGELPPTVSLIPLGGNGRRGSSYQAVLRYLREHRPDVLMSGKDEAHETALQARQDSGVDVALVMRPGTVVSAKFRLSRFWRTWHTYRYMRGIYPRADRIIAVSRGVARDTARITGVPEQSIKVIHSPIVSTRLHEMAAAAPEHPWLTDKQSPVLVAAGRLGRQKGYDNLLRAVARARQSLDFRLIILGQGHLRASLEKMAQNLEIDAHVDFAGFRENPYPIMAQADLFVLSSVVEGLGNVIVEALALGRRVVATDCPCGPREILQDNPCGQLVAPRDPQAFANAIVEGLRAGSPDPETARASVSHYSRNTSALNYKNFFQTLTNGTTARTC